MEQRFPAMVSESGDGQLPQVLGGHHGHCCRFGAAHSPLHCLLVSVDILKVLIIPLIRCVKQRRLQTVADSSSAQLYAHRPVVTISPPFIRKEVFCWKQDD